MNSKFKLITNPNPWYKNKNIKKVVKKSNSINIKYIIFIFLLIIFILLLFKKL